MTPTTTTARSTMIERLEAQAADWQTEWDAHVAAFALGLPEGRPVVAEIVAELTPVRPERQPVDPEFAARRAAARAAREHLR
jgi:hypothetical protein